MCIAGIDLSRHYRDMRTAVICFAIPICAGCSGSEATHRSTATPTGWRYVSGQGAFEGRLSYVDPAREAKFAGICDGEPSYFLKDGNYSRSATSFTLVVDDRSWKLPISQTEHGRLLPVERQEQQAAISNARQRIIFQVGSWRYELKPGAELAAFARNCS